MLPEVGDEVLVAFAQGDLEHPYVLGGLYNGVDKPHGGWAPSVDGSGEVVQRGFVSRTGMVLELLEKAGAESVVLSTNGGAQKIVLTQTAVKGIEILSEGAVEGAGQAGRCDVTHQPRQRDPQGHERHRRGDRHPRAQGTNVKLAGQAMAEVSASGPTTIKGAIVRIN